VRGLKVTQAELPDYVERLTRRFLAERAADQTFAEWALAAPEAALQ
jgi:sulfite reductase (ferredoxin)